MKDNEKKAAVLVIQAMKQLGFDNALGTARTYLGLALNHINEVTKKRERREKIIKEEENKKKLSALKQTERIQKLLKIEEEERRLRQNAVNKQNEWDYPDDD